MHGYSSSSESDDYYRQKRQPVPATTTSTDANKKKKKRKLPPQKTINRTWKRFSNKKFSKALAVLPFDPVLPPAVSGNTNELFEAGYNRAAEECRRKVKKIIQECRRVNMRYRDPGWDLDWDLKMEKGHCLNSLGSTMFDLSMTNLMNPSSLVPKAVRRVHEIFEKPTFMEKLSGSDVKQGNLGDCWLIASLSGLANVKDGMKRICVEYDTRIGIYGFVFFRDGEWIYSIIDDKLYLKSPGWDSPSMQRSLLQQIDREDVERVYRQTYQTGSKALFFAQCKDQNETWVPLVEKAYAKAHGDYASLSGGWIGEGLEDLSGGVTTELLASDILDLDGFWADELSRVNDEFLFGCSTGLLDGGYGNRDGICEGHAYVVMEARTLKNGTRLVKLRNPWGKARKGIWEGAWSDGSKEWTTEVQEELGHHFGGDSVFWISYDDLLHKYQHFDRTRLFRDPDWRCCQRWMGVDVPWKPQFNEKLHIKLTRESPLVLVLSQLDNRYFKGLRGQYLFRLHFRLHELNSPGAEDYIVRSHGNYLMNRSVSIELPCMLPGSYSVFISVVGERVTSCSSVEEVVKRECKARVENEKLAQVGHAYDLAHSKATEHLEAVAALRKKADQKRASESRTKERRRQWEKRHTTRDITKKQGRKNNKKLDAKTAAKTAAREEKAKEEARAEEAKVAAQEEKRKKEEEMKPRDKAVQTEEGTGEEKKEDGNRVKAEDETSKDSRSESKDDDLKKTDDKTEEAKSDEAKDDSKADPESRDKDEQKAKDQKDAKVEVEIKDEDETPETTPIHTPTVTPTEEKTEEEASGEKTETDEKTAEEMGRWKDKADQKKEEASGGEKPKSEETKKEEASGGEKPKSEEAKKQEASGGEKPKPEEAKKQEASGGEKPKPEETKEGATGEKAKTEEKSGDKAEDKTGDAASAGSSDTSGSPKDTPKSEASTLAKDGKDGKDGKNGKDKAVDKAKAKVAVPPADSSTVSGAPPPAPASTTAKTGSAATKPKVYATSDGESSASPIEEWEELYSSDNMTRKPRPPSPPHPPGTVLQSKYADETDDEKAPDAWNAICVVGFRVYSKDEDLQLRVVMEGGTLEEGGMGEKGEEDLDNAQSNAGGRRGQKEEVVVEETAEEDGGYEGDSEIEKEKD